MMKRNYRYITLIILFVLIGVGIFVAVSCSKQVQSDNKAKQLYTCGMHPEVIRDEPGLCPICNMKLVPLNQGETAKKVGVTNGERKVLYWIDSMMNPPYISDKPGKSPMGMDLVPVYEDEATGGTGVTIDPAIIQNIGVRYGKVARGPLEKTIRAAAHVDYDEDHLAVLSTRAEGWVEKLYVKTPGVSVKAGQPLFEFYSPKLYSAQEEYRIALRVGDSSLASAAHERLRLLGVSDSEINSIRSKGTRRTLTINAPIDGVVVSIGSSSSGAGMASAVPVSSSGGMNGMSGGGSSSGSGAGGMNSQSGAQLREGDFVGSGNAIFTIADLSKLWVYGHIFEEDLPYVKVGMKASLELDYLQNQKIDGTVDFIYPFLDKQTRDIKLRMTFPNENGKLMPDMYGKVLLESKIADDVLIIPMESVLNSGDRRIVFISLEGGRFIPQDVVLGPSDGKGNVQVISGLYEGQTVVTSAQFLIDSESHLKEALNKMIEEKSGIPQTQPEEKPSQTETTPANENEMKKTEEMKMDNSSMAKPENKREIQSNKSSKPERKMKGMQMDNSSKSKAKDEKKTDSNKKSSDMEGMNMSEMKDTNQSKEEKWSNLAPDDPKAKFKCPMPNDRYYAAEDGDCPICGMHLVPNDPKEWKKTHSK